ncbi:MAG: translation initiation factor IF-2, partial [Dysgonamonadaceae bacterium]|nr:translation initiation factor IF-2 [Dysgonamonadaceae bacterium]
MSIRLNRVTRNLNVGLSTVVEFLQKKGFPTEENPNTKISDEEYKLLVSEFDKDKIIKLESEKISHERHQKEKKETVAVEGYAPQQAEEIKIEISEDIRPKVVTVGKIDLNTIGKKHKPKEKTVVPRIEEIKKDARKKTVIVPEKEEVLPAYAEGKNEMAKEAGKTKDIEEDIKEGGRDNTDDDISDNITAEEDTNAKEEPLMSPGEQSVFRLNKQHQGPEIKVTGKIDLNSINQSTRPKPKTRAEKRRERVEKEKKAALAAQIKKTEQE